MIKKILSFPLSLFNSLFSRFTVMSERIKRKLNEPMQSNFLSRNGIFQALVAALAVFAIAFTIEPFGISQFSSPNKVFLLCSLALSGFIGVSISMFVLPSIFTSFYNKNNWSVSKAILGNIITSFFFGLFVMVFGNQIGLTQFNLPIELLKFTGIFAACALIYNFALQSTLNKKFIAKSEKLTTRIMSAGLIENKSQIFPITKFVGANDIISLLPNQLIRVETDKYSSEFVYQNLFGTAVKTLDIPLKEVQKELANFEQFVQLNKSVYVNKNAISQATGNAAGIKVAISKIEEPIKVTKKYLKNL